MSLDAITFSNRNYSAILATLQINLQGSENGRVVIYLQGSENGRVVTIGTFRTGLKPNRTNNTVMGLS